MPGDLSQLYRGKLTYIVGLKIHRRVRDGCRVSLATAPSSKTTW